MKIVSSLCLILLCLGAIPPADILSSYQWRYRVIIMKADSAQNLYHQQKQLFEQNQAALDERDLVIIRLFDDHGLDAERNPLSKKDYDFLKAKYGAGNKSFRISLIGKDGGLKFAANRIVQPNELFAIIDQMPMRRQEMKRKQ